MIDQYKREIDYLRISVTDRCNLRCLYCMPEVGIPCLKHSDILTFEEILRVVEAAAAIGIQKIKITGGEPLVRKGIIHLIKNINDVPGIKEVTMTSNGVLLKDMAKELKEAGLSGINISLDTLDRKKYKQITRFDNIEEVLLGIQAVKEMGIKTKINCVPMKGFNEDDIIEIAAFANQNVDVRFIELMPIGLGKDYEMISTKEILLKLENKYGKGIKSIIKSGNGPAIYYKFPEIRGNIGFISAMTNEFCEDCNRIRLTSEGDLKLCLHHNQGISLKPLLRNEITSEKLQSIMQDAIYHKPNHHCFNDKETRNMEQRKMFQIGG
jgi:GTP 3',8-cyclase